MAVSTFPVMVVGELTPWGKSFVAALENAEALTAAFESSAEKFCETHSVTLQAPVVLIENCASSRSAITRMRESAAKFYLVWFGRSFTKEDLEFALQYRVYTVLEEPHPEDKQLLEIFKRLRLNQENSSQFSRLLHSMKTLLLQAETDGTTSLMATEIKNALLKLEWCGTQNEMIGVSAETASEESKSLFHKTQDFSGALNMVHDLERTGTLWVRSAKPGQEGRVEFLQGKIVAAFAGETRGLKAVYRLFLWDQPTFVFTRRDPKDCLIDEHITESMSYLCAQGNDLRTRYESLRRELPPVDLALRLEPQALNETIHLSNEEFETLASVIEFGRVDQVLDYNPLPDAVLFESLITLRRNRMIRVAG